MATPDTVEDNRPAVCGTCQAELSAEAAVVGRERRPVCELPPRRLVVQEPQALHVRCSQCQQVSVEAFPAVASSRAQYGPRLRALAVYLVGQQFVPYARVRSLLAEGLGLRLSTGTLVQWM